MTPTQIRPENPEHLWQTGNYMDWPDNDPDGHIVRMRNNTMPGSNGDGDMRLAPLLEITIPAPGANGNNIVGDPTFDCVTKNLTLYLRYTTAYGWRVM